MPRDAFVLKIQRELCHPKYARKVSGLSRNRLQAPVSRTSRRVFGPVKPFLKLRPAYSVKLVFSYVVKGIKIKITAKFRASRRLRFEDTKRIMSPEMRPKRFGTFEKRAPGLLSTHHEPCTYHEPADGDSHQVVCYHDIRGDAIVVISYNITSPSFTDQTIPGC